MTELESLRPAGINGLKPDKKAGVNPFALKNVSLILVVGRGKQMYE